MDRTSELFGKLNGKKILAKENHNKKYDSELFEEKLKWKIRVKLFFIIQMMG